MPLKPPQGHRLQVKIHCRLMFYGEMTKLFQ